MILSPVRVAILAVCLSTFGCAPDPFGVDCQTSPACQGREARRHDEAMAAKRRACAASGRAWVSEDDRSAGVAPASLACEPAGHACEGTFGCDRGSCWPTAGATTESRYCLDEGTSYEGHCVSCADRAKMGEDRVRFLADYQRQLYADLQRDAADEVAAGECRTYSLTRGDAALSTLAREIGDLPRAGDGHLVTTSAGADFTVTPPRAGQRYELLLASPLSFTVHGPGARTVAGVRTPGTTSYALARVSIVADRAPQAWRVEGQGCVRWRLLGVP